MTDVSTLKVAYVVPSLQGPSGWRSHAQAFLRAIAYHVEPVLFVASADLLEARTLFPGCQVYPLPATQGAALSNLRGFGRLMGCFRQVASSRYTGIDLVHSLEAYPTGLIGHWLARRCRCPHVITAHGTYGVIWKDYWPDRLVYSRVLRGSSLVCPVSHGTAALMQGAFGAALAGVQVRPILNGNDYHRKVRRDVALRREKSDVPTLLTVGEVKPRKGQHVSLAAFSQVKARLPRARYWIVGRIQPGEYLSRLQDLIAKQRIEDVQFLGVVPDNLLDMYYRRASVFALTPQPSQEGARLQFEGFGLVYLEAGAYGLPVIGTATGGVPDAVKNGETGFLLGPDDVKGIADAMLALLDDADLARRMGAANRRWAETLTWERTAAEQHQAYLDVLGHKRA